MKPGRIIAAIVGALVGIIAFGLIVGGVVLAVVYGTQRDADGFITSPEFDLSSSAYAISSDEIDLAARPGDWFPRGLADVRLAVDGPADLFIGIGPAADVNRYLDGVAVDEVTQLGPATSDVRLERVAGDAAPPGAPDEQDFWVEQGAGVQAELTWEVDDGEWVVVLMNRDGTPQVDASLVAGARVPILLGIAVGLIIFGLLVAAAATALLIWATMRPRGAVAETVAASAPARAGTYPVALEGRIDPGLTRWMWLVKWLLAIPHFVVLAFLWVGFALMTVVAFFAILFSGRYPRGIFDFNVGVLRWTWRVTFYTYSAGATDQYPPFTLADVEYPARFDVPYPQRLSRGLVLVKWWLLAIPHYLIVAIFTSGLIWWGTDIGDGDSFLDFGGGLVGLLVLIALIILLFRGKYPPRLFDLIMGLNRWGYRVIAYAALMRDEYPPFRLDLGGEEQPGDVAGESVPVASDS